MLRVQLFLPLLVLAISGYASVVEREGRHFVEPTNVSEASPSHHAGCQSQPLKPLSIPDIFVPLDKSEPDFPKASLHTVQPVGLSGKRPIPTTNFFTNFILGDQSKPIFCHPYTLTWSGCAQEACHYGIGVVHTDSSDFQFARGDPTPYYYSDNDKHQIVLSAAELGPTTVLTTESFKAASITIGLAPQKQGVVMMRIPVVQGMGLVTAEYINGTPRIQSLVGISELIPESVSGETGLFRYRAVLVDGAEWMIYIRPTGTTTRPEFTKDNANTFTATKSGFKGIIQIAKAPIGLDVTSIYDQTAGAYPTGVSITGSVEKDHGSYSIAWEKAGDAKKTLLMFALPHHVSSFTEQTRQKLTKLSLRTTTKGTARAVLADRLSFVEEKLPSQIGTELADAPCKLNSTTRAFIQGIVQKELDFNIEGVLQSQGSIYWAGKMIASYAKMVQAASKIIEEPQPAATGLEKMKRVLATWIDNAQLRKMVYDETWGGIITSWAAAAQDNSVDYGNAIFNDHHFHYGMWVYTASIVALMDPTWLTPKNKAWVTSLIRDYANPSSKDPHFPFSRSFDWYHGHSWALGLDVSQDGKNAESSSEDAFSIYAIKLWAQAIGDTAMEARATLQLAIMKRTIGSYFLMQSNNKVFPSEFLGNKVIGILHENKADYRTWFGNYPEYIHGIHMLPISPISPYIRSKEFATEEWSTHFNSSSFQVQDPSWTSILHANQANFDPKASYAFFSSPNFQQSFLMDGDSRAYYLMHSGLLAGY